MSDRPLPRRTLLRRGLAAAGAAAAGTTAGCSSLFSGGGDDTGAFTQWLPKPGAIGAAEHYWFDYYDLERLASQRETLGGEPTVFERTWRPVGLDWADATSAVAVDSADVVTADFTRSDAVSDLEDAGYSQGDEYEGSTLYHDADGRTVFGVTDGTLVVSRVDRYASDPVDPASRVRAVLDAQTGDVTRYAEASEDMQTLVDELGTATFVSGATRDDASGVEAESGRYEGLVAEGSTSTFDGGTVAEKWVYVYDSPQDVDIDALRAYVEANDDGTGGSSAPFATVGDIAYEKKGRKGIITGTRAADEYYEDA
ncbi:hypothetical protein NDI56_12115 [Haloarcula sp. S1CR25-12]|uniref:Uncharacterized protein n=1 Tax=Haloarcula saliterrae TaxID=2950534 RepID=A0ABU2FE95_9EURY|nr:hypothetical protein [Haloarcula sp. S1CR25-12]MDS0260140.1 hypothetical protein [Haloarcula sp. S1CR25-12]